MGTGRRSRRGTELGNARVTFGFEPGTGRITARLAEATLKESAVPDAPESFGQDGLASTCGGRLAVKAWNRPEIEALLRLAGLKLERLYGDWDGRAPETSGTGRLIVVASKPRRALKRTAGR